MKKIFLSIFLILFSLNLAAQHGNILHYQDSAPVGMGARAMGMGGAFIAIADDATTITWNPGGLGQIEDIEISLIGSTRQIEIFRAAEISDYYRARDGEHFESYQNAYYDRGNGSSFDFIGITVPVRPFAESDFKLVFQYCYQTLANFNMEINQTKKRTYKTWTQDDLNWWEDNYYYRTMDLSGGRFMHSFGTGVKIGKWLNIGASANIIVGSTEIDVFTSTESFMHNESGEKLHSLNESSYTQNETYSGTSFSLGALFLLPENINLGIVYKSPYTIDTNLEVKSYSYESQVTLQLPACYGAGLSFRPIDNLTLAADITYTEYSHSKATNKTEGTVTYYPAQELVYNPDAEDDRLKQHDSTQLRFGGEYVFITGDLLLALRGGIFWDKRFYADFTGEIPIHLGLTAGLGIVWKSFVLDTAVVITLGDELDSQYSTGPSEFSSTTFIGSVILRL